MGQPLAARFPQRHHVVIMEGRNREVRRLWESQDVTVSRLKRVRFGTVAIPSLLKPGDWLELGKGEVDALIAEDEAKRLAAMEG